MVAMSDSFDVPQAVQNAAKRGLEMRRKYGRGGLDSQQAHDNGVGSGVQRASDLMSGRVSYRTIKRMAAFFSRHRKNKDSRMPNGEPGAGMIAWLIWGGDPGDRWARSVIEREEGVKKGSLAHLVMFGQVSDEDAIDNSTIEAIDNSVVKALSFRELLDAARPKPMIPLLDEDKLVEVSEEYEFDGMVVPAEAPADAIAPTEPRLSVEQAQLIAEAQSDEEAQHILGMNKGVVEIDLMEDYVQPAPEPPPMKHPEEKPTDPPHPEPALQEVGTEIQISPAAHALLRKSIRASRKGKGLESEARRQGELLEKGQWGAVDLDVVQAYLSFIDDPAHKANAAAVGGEVMLKLIEKALPKVPEKYLEGLSGEERAKRKREIQRRMKDKDRGEKYADIPGDDAKTEPSKYSKTAFASKVREEMKGSGKDEFLRAAAKVSGVSRAILDEVYRRGSEAWATGGHRPGASQEAWARARVYSFCTGGKTRRTADSDLWSKHKQG